MSVIFRVLGAELRFTFCWALTDPSVALNNGPNMAAAAALRNIDRRVRADLCRLLIAMPSGFYVGNIERTKAMILLSEAEKNATHYPFFAGAIPIG